MRYLYEAVFAALDQIGPQTSIERLRRKAEELWVQDGNRNYHIDIGYVCVLRKRWEEKQGSDKKDCRTYQGQPDRDMVATSAVGLTEVIETLKIVGGVKKARTIMDQWKKLEVQLTPVGGVKKLVATLAILDQIEQVTTLKKAA